MPRKTKPASTQAVVKCGRSCFCGFAANKEGTQNTLTLCACAICVCVCVCRVLRYGSKKGWHEGHEAARIRARPRTSNYNDSSVQLYDRNSQLKTDAMPAQKHWEAPWTTKRDRRAKGSKTGGNWSSHSTRGAWPAPVAIMPPTVQFFTPLFRPFTSAGLATVGLGVGQAWAASPALEG